MSYMCGLIRSVVFSEVRYSAKNSGLIAYSFGNRVFSVGAFILSVDFLTLCFVPSAGNVSCRRLSNPSEPKAGRLLRNAPSEEQTVLNCGRLCSCFGDNSELVGKVQLYLVLHKNSFLLVFFEFFSGSLPISLDVLFWGKQVFPTNSAAFEFQKDLDYQKNTPINPILWGGGGGKIRSLLFFLHHPKTA